MSRDDAVRAAAEALRARSVAELRRALRVPTGYLTPEECAEAAVDAAAPHLTADLVRERDEALAEVERLRAWSLTLVSEVNAKASEARSWHAMWESAALRGDQP